MPDLTRTMQRRQDQLLVMLATKLEGRHSNLRDAFLSLDKDRSGTIEPHEFRDVLGRFQIRISESEFQSLLGRFDAHNNGTISFQAFREAISGRGAPMGRPVEEFATLLSPRSAAALRNVETRLAKHLNRDLASFSLACKAAEKANRQTFLSRKEFRQLLQRFSFRLSNAEYEKLCKVYDPQRSGVVTRPFLKRMAALDPNAPAQPAEPEQPRQQQQQQQYGGLPSLAGPSGARGGGGGYGGFGAASGAGSSYPNWEMPAVGFSGPWARPSPFGSLGQPWQPHPPSGNMRPGGYTRPNFGRWQAPAPAPAQPAPAMAMSPARIRAVEAKLAGQLQTQHKNLYSVFRNIDRDRSGTISAQEFTHVLARAGISLLPGEHEALIRKYDTDGTGAISLEAFMGNFGAVFRPSGHGMAEEITLHHHDDPRRSKQAAFAADLRAQIAAKQARQERQKQKSRQRQTAQAVYDPWGKGGGGAPLRDASGSVLANLKEVRNGGATPASSTARQRAQHQMQQQQQQQQMQMQFQMPIEAPPPALTVNTGRFGAPPPPMMAVQEVRSPGGTDGAVSPSGRFARYQASKMTSWEQEKAQRRAAKQNALKNDLQQQIELKRRRKEQERQAVVEEERREARRLEMQRMELVQASAKDAARLDKSGRVNASTRTDAEWKGANSQIHTSHWGYKAVPENKAVVVGGDGGGPAGSGLEPHSSSPMGSPRRSPRVMMSPRMPGRDPGTSALRSEIAAQQRKLDEMKRQMDTVQKERSALQQSSAAYDSLASPTSPAAAHSNPRSILGAAIVRPPVKLSSKSEFVFFNDKKHPGVSERPGLELLRDALTAPRDKHKPSPLLGRTNEQDPGDALLFDFLHRRRTFAS